MGIRRLKSSDKTYVELDLEPIAETEKAILVSDGTRKVWVPTSQLEDFPEHLSNGLVRIIIPEWLAFEKGLI